MKRVLLGSAIISLGVGAAVGAGAEKSGTSRLGQCPARGAQRIKANDWSPSRRSLAPMGASGIRLCRYAGLNASPKLALEGAALITHAKLISKLTHEFDALRAQRGPVACPLDDGSQITATLAYRDGHQVVISVGLSGCEIVTNGNLARTTASYANSNPTGPRLSAQLRQLTRKHKSA